MLHIILTEIILSLKVLIYNFNFFHMLYFSFLWFKKFDQPKKYKKFNNLFFEKEEWVKHAVQMTFKYNTEEI